MSAELVPPSVQRFVKDLVLIARESADEASRRADAMQTVSTFVDGVCAGAACERCGSAHAGAPQILNPGLT